MGTAVQIHNVGESCPPDLKLTRVARLRTVNEHKAGRAKCDISYLATRGVEMGSGWSQLGNEKPKQNQTFQPRMYISKENTLAVALYFDLACFFNSSDEISQ